jgi:hypothetical protein
VAQHSRRAGDGGPAASLLDELTVIVHCGLFPELNRRPSPRDPNI